MERVYSKPLNMRKETILAMTQIFIQENAEESYKEFSQKLLPNVTNIAGVRLSKMHKYVNNLLKEELDSGSISLLTDSTFEETMITGLLIAKGPWSRSERKKLIRKFVPKIKNWSHCDTFCKFIYEVDETYWSMIVYYAHTKSEFRQRFALVMMIEHFIQEAYIPRIFALLEEMSPKGYYAKMAIAWLLAMIYNDFPNDVMVYLQQSTLDKWTINKTFQKIKQSLKTTAEQLKSLDNQKRTIFSHLQ